MAQTLKITVVGDSKKAEQMFRNLGSQAGGFGNSVTRASRAAGIALVAIGTAAAAGIGSAVKTTVDFDRSMRNVNSIAKLNEKQFGQLEKSVLGMAAAVGQKPKVLADGLYDIESSGFSANAAVKVLRVSAKAATAGLTDTATASKAVTAALNAYHMGADQARKVSDILFQTVNKGVLTFQELSDNMGDLVPASAPLGISLEEVGAGMATLTLQGVPAAEAATRMKNAMISLAKPTPALSKLLKKNGYETGTAAVKALGFAGVLDMLSKATHGSVAAQAALTPNIRTLLGVVGLTGKNLAIYNQNLRAMQSAQKGAGITAQVFAEQSKSVGVMWQKVNAAIDVFKIQIGTALLPALKVGLSAVSGFLTKLDKASGFQAKIQVVFDAGKDAGIALEQKLTAVVAGINWTAAGAAIAAGLGTAVAQAKEWATALNGMFAQIDWIALGRKAGPGIVAALASAIATALDPAFWIKNWDLALAIGVAFFGKGLGKVAGKLAAPLAKVFGDALLEVLVAVERWSPRLAATLLAAVARLPGILGRALSLLEAVVGKAFGRLGGLAKFTLRVLGVEAVLHTVITFATTVKGWIDRVVAWFKGLPGRVIGALSGISLYSIGVSIIQGLWEGMKHKGGEMLSWLKNELTPSIPLHKGPPSKDAKLLYANGQLIMGGLLRGMQDGWMGSERFLSTIAGRLQAAMNRLQAQIDASQQAAQDRSNAQALADANKQLAEAKKNGKGVADAENAIQTALQQIRDTANQRELDRMTRQHDKILAKLQALKDKAAAKLQALQDAAGSAFDALAGKIQSAFNAKSDAWVSPAQAMIDQIQRGDQQQQLEQAVADAQAGVADAMANGGDILAAQASLQSAQHDLLINGVGGLADQAAAQDRAHQQLVDSQQETLDLMLGNLRTSLTTQGATWDGAMKQILGIVGSYDGSFADIGTLLGQAFVASLKAAMGNVAGAASQVAGKAGSGAFNVPGAGSESSAFKGGYVKMAAGGVGTVTRPTVFLAGEAGREDFAFSGAGKSFGSGSGSPVTVNVYGDVSGDEVVQKVISGVNRVIARQGSVFRPGAVAT